MKILLFPILLVWSPVVLLAAAVFAVPAAIMGLYIFIDLSRRRTAHQAEVTAGGRVCTWEEVEAMAAAAGGTIIVDNWLLGWNYFDAWWTSDVIPAVPGAPTLIATSTGDLDSMVESTRWIEPRYLSPGTPAFHVQSAATSRSAARLFSRVEALPARFPNTAIAYTTTCYLRFLTDNPQVGPPRPAADAGTTADSAPAM